MSTNIALEDGIFECPPVPRSNVLSGCWGRAELSIKPLFNLNDQDLVNADTHQHDVTEKFWPCTIIDRLYFVPWRVLPTWKGATEEETIFLSVGFKSIYLDKLWKWACKVVVGALPGITTPLDKVEVHKYIEEVDSQSKM